MKDLANTLVQEKNLENIQDQVIMKNLAKTLVQEKNLENTQDQVITRNPVSTQDQEKNPVNTQDQEPKFKIDLKQIVEHFIASATKIYNTFLTLPQDPEITKNQVNLLAQGTMKNPVTPDPDQVIGKSLHQHTLLSRNQHSLPSPQQPNQLLLKQLLQV